MDQVKVNYGLAPKKRTGTMVRPRLLILFSPLIAVESMRS